MGIHWTEVWRDEDLLVVHKPAGVPTQGTRKGEPNLFDALREQESGAVSLHHRLDQPASGLVLFGRKTSLDRDITEAFRTHTIQRHYAALLVGRLPKASLTWDQTIDGQAAQSSVRCLGHVLDLVCVHLQLTTGRTHQLRRHAAMAGVPIAGDRRYGGPAGGRCARLALHAATMCWQHPRTGQRHTWHAPLPEPLASTFARAGVAGSLLTE